MRNSSNDAALVADAPEKQGFQVRLVDDPSCVEVAVLYFSGHGMEAQSVNYVLVARDTRLAVEPRPGVSTVGPLLRTSVA